VARGTTGAPRNTPDPDVPADGGDIRAAQTHNIQERGARGERGPGDQQIRPGRHKTSPDQGRPGKPRGISHLIAFICGRRTKWVVVLFWLLVVVALGSLAGKLQGAEKNDASSYLPGTAESTQELNEQAAFQSKNYNPAIVVYVRDTGVTAADIAKANADARYFATLPAVNGRVAPPIISSDHKAIETVVGSDLGYNSDISGFITTVQNTATKDSGGLRVYIGGPAASANDELKIFKGIDSTLLYSALAVVIVLLLLTYRSPVLWLLPIISAGVALTLAEAVIYLLVEHANLVVNGQSGGILVVLVLGASTDYALLLVARYREELRRHEDRHQAMAVALRRAGPAIIASGLTVIVGMLCLMAAESNDISGLGPVAAIGVGVGLIAMITLLPALLVVCGRWVFWPIKPRYGSPEPTRRGVWARVGNAISRRPRGVWVVTALLLAAFWAGLIGFKIGTLTAAQSFRGTPSSITAQNVLAKYFPAGTGEPVDVIANAASAEQVRSALADTPGIASVTAPVTKGGLTWLEATMTVPPDSPAAYTLVDHIRITLHAIPGADAKVGGGTAVNKDVESAAAHDRDLLIPLILGVVLLILGVLLRAIVAPLVLIATVVLSFGTALGLSSLFFKHVFGFAGADTSVPLFVFVFLVALGIDYNIFLMTRVREESIRSGTWRGALTGLAATGGVITSAGLVLAGTFAVLGTLPLVEFTEIGFAVAVGVLIDTIIVRSVLVTALNLDIGRHMWWPSALAHRQPQAGDMVPQNPPVGRSVTDGT
jgi:RND superfamily putative drug exporter